MIERPSITLLMFKQSTFKKLWNIEVGVYEEFNNIEDIEWCGWVMCSKQDTVYRLEPNKVDATVYHLEYNGEATCGRCPGFNGGLAESCMALACQPACKPHRPIDQQQGPPIESRYKKWMKEIKCLKSKNS